MALGPIRLYKGLGVECTALSIFFPILLILALLISEIPFKSYFESNTIVLLTKGLEIPLAIWE